MQLDLDVHMGIPQNINSKIGRCPDVVANATHIDTRCSVGERDLNGLLVVVEGGRGFLDRHGLVVDSVEQEKGKLYYALVLV